MSFIKLVNEYAIVGESVVKLTKTKPLAYWQNATGEQLGTEHNKQAHTFRRKFANAFLKLLDKKMTKKLNSTFGTKQLMESAVNLVDTGALSGVWKNVWLKNYINTQSDSSNVQDGVGYDLVLQRSVTDFPNGLVRIVRSLDNQFLFSLMSDDEKTGESIVPPDTACTIHVTFLQFGLDDPATPLPEVGQITIEGIGMDNSFEIDLNNYALPFYVPSIDTHTYMIARIEFTEVNLKGKVVSYQKGKFDTLQIVGTRL